MASYDYDLFVIGGGSGGVRAARLAGALGKRVGLAEAARIGGTCVIQGCVPKKLMMYAAAYGDVFKESASFGWSAPEYSFNFQDFVEKRDNEITRLEGIYTNNLKRNQVEIYKSKASLLGENEIALLDLDKKITAKNIIIATGASSLYPSALEGAQHCLLSQDIFALKELPSSLLVLGAGYIGIEFASIFHGLGVPVTLLHRGDCILRSFDRELTQELTQSLQARGIKICLNTNVKEIMPPEQGLLAAVTANGEKYKAHKILLALGRVPHTQGLGLERAGINCNAAGFIEVNSFMQTGCKNIFAIGDVVNNVMLTPLAIHQAMCVIQTLFGGQKTPADESFIPSAVFSLPELGTIGYSEEEAVEKFPLVEVYRARFRPMKNSLSPEGKPVLMKLLVDGGSKKVIGAHILGENAAEMVQLVAIALKAGLTKADFDKTMALHPTTGEELVTMYKPSFIYQNGKKVEQ